jgi:hypothetical protein
MLDRKAKIDFLYERLAQDAAGQYGTSGSYELEAFMATVEEQLEAMIDEELDATVAEHS